MSGELTQQQEDAIANERQRVVLEVGEPILWAMSPVRKGLEPFVGSTSTSEQKEWWSCWGCDGEFESSWPLWIKPTDATFPHSTDCKYKRFLVAISSLTTTPEKNPHPTSVPGGRITGRDVERAAHAEYLRSAPLPSGEPTSEALDA